MEKMFRLTIGNRVRLKRPLITLTSMTKQFMDTNVQIVHQQSNQMLLVNEFVCIFYRTNLLKKVDMVFEVNKYLS